MSTATPQLPSDRYLKARIMDGAHGMPRVRYD